jgi:outer membrane protein OmpA-like peptidoglycan-associated protein
MAPLLIWSALILSLPFITSTPKTTVVLLENDAVHNAVDVTTRAGSVVIDQPYYYTTLISSDMKPAVVEKADPEMIRQKYETVLSVLPLKAVSMLFYFEPGAAEITQESKDQVESLITLIEAREPVSIDIIGHTDRAGDADKNYELALDRAHTVERFLLERNVTLERSSVTSHGENDPIVPTEDGVAEPKNRRVEVIVR